MAVYFAPRNNYNAWLGGGGRTGILDILGQGLLQPMLMREMAAKNYQYEDRLRAAEAERAAAESQRGCDFETAKIESERSYRDKNREGFMGGVRSMPGYVPGSDAVYGYATDVGYNGNVSDLTGALMPKQEQVSTGDKLISRTMYPDGTAGGSTSFNVGLSPKDAGTLELARRNAAINEWATRQKVAQGWQTANRANLAQLMPDGSGGYAWVDGYNRTVRPAFGIVPTSPELTPKDTAGIFAEISKAKAEAMKGALTPADRKLVEDAFDPQLNTLLQKMGLAEPSANPTSMYDPETITPRPSGGGGGFMTTAEVEAEAKRQRIPVEQVIRDAKQRGIRIERSKY